MFVKQGNVTVSKLVTSPDLIIITSVGKSFTFDENLGSWLCLTDTSSSIQGCSNYATASANMPTATKDLPLASLGYLTPVQPPKLQSTVDQQTMALGKKDALKKYEQFVLITSCFLHYV